MNRVLALVKRVRGAYLAPVLAFFALSAWAFASPVGAGPDDDYHLVSVWCANGGSAQCEPGSQPGERMVASELIDVACFAQDGDASAACQRAVWDAAGESSRETVRGNFYGEYPPVYYATMRLLASSDVQVSALVMRIVNAALFVGLATVLAVLLPAGRRRALLWGWLVTLVPLGVFLVPSNNPSGWALTGVGTAFLALVGWLESTGRRRWMLGALYVVGVLLAGGARGDAAVYAAGATVAATLVALPTGPSWWKSLLLPLGGFALAVVLFTLSGQTGVFNTGFAETPGADGGSAGGGPELAGLTLAAYNLLMLPLLWTEVWGTWGLGWIDTQLPAIVPWAAVSAFVVVGFAGLARLAWRKIVALVGVLFVLVALPVHVLTTGGHQVGENLQPRYLLPLIALFAFTLLTDPARRGVSFSRAQTLLIFGALAGANLVALQVNIRRYVTGADEQGFNLDAGAEWWWTGFPVGPTWIWILGALAYAGTLAALWPQLRAKRELPVDAELRP